MYFVKTTVLSESILRKKEELLELEFVPTADDFIPNDSADNSKETCKFLSSKTSLDLKHYR